MLYKNLFLVPYPLHNSIDCLLLWVANCDLHTFLVYAAFSKPYYSYINNPL